MTRAEMIANLKSLRAEAVKRGMKLLTSDEINARLKR